MQCCSVRLYLLPILTQQMKRFIIRSLIYLSPLLIVLASVYFVDPYYLFHREATFNEQKYEIGYSFDQGRRYKIFTFMNNPTDKIILGASEINIINERNIPEQGWHSLSYGGAPLQESLRMYWEISKNYKLTKVMIAPEFIKYYNAISSTNGDPYYANFNWKTSQSAKALEIYDNKLDYFIDKYTLKSTWSYLNSTLFSQAIQGKPKESKKDFWRHQIGYAKKIYSGNTSFDEKRTELLSQFRRIKEDADRKGIDIMIVIPIQHVELIKEELSDNVYEIYKDYIYSLSDIFGRVYYLAYLDDISDNAELFSDPFHCTEDKPYLDNLFGSDKMVSLEKDSVYKYLDTLKDKISRNE